MPRRVTEDVDLPCRQRRHPLDHQLGGGVDVTRLDPDAGWRQADDDGTDPQPPAESPPEHEELVTLPVRRGHAVAVDPDHLEQGTGNQHGDPERHDAADGEQQNGSIHRTTVAERQRGQDRPMGDCPCRVDAADPRQPVPDPVASPAAGER